MARDLVKDRVYRHLKARIIDGSIAEGEFFTEGEIANDLGISRTPVREALLMLEAESLVKLLPKKGAYVPPVSDRQARQINEVRGVVEVFAARRAVERSQAIVDVLSDHVERQRALAAAGDVAGFIACDREFHETIVHAANNQILTDLYSSLRDHQLRMGMATILNSPERYEQVLAEHQAVVDAVRRGDETALVSAIEAHLATTLKAFLGDRDIASAGGTG